MTTASKVTVHMVASLDGYIVDEDGGVSWLDTSDHFEAGVEAEDPTGFLESIGCWVIGSRTYEQALQLGWPYGDKPTYVLTRRDLAPGPASVRFRSGDLRRLVAEELEPHHRNIWVCGGAELVREFLRADLVDEICVTIAPIVIGAGLPYFDQIGVKRALHLEEVKAYQNGMVELRYEVLRD
ncbi:MAG: dihydrofolate reductase [Planctomycetes bacterium]|nr:dihydrofolate reductase [Planctomycetota bacterium]